MADMQVADALRVLEGAASSSRAHAALKTLRAELEGSQTRTNSDAPTPGQRASGRSGPPDFLKNTTKASAATRFRSARG